MVSSEHKQLGDTAFGRGQYEAASAAYTRALCSLSEAGSNDPCIKGALLANRCIAQLKAGGPAAAAAALVDARESLRLRPRWAEAHLRLAQASSCRGQAGREAGTVSAGVLATASITKSVPAPARTSPLPVPPRLPTSPHLPDPHSMQSLEACGSGAPAVASYRRAAELDASLSPAVAKALSTLERAASRKRCLLTLQGHQGPIYDAAIHPTPLTLGAVTTQLIATAGADASLRLWCSATGLQLQQLEGHGDRVTRLHWSPCGSLLASASLDGTARLWALQASSSLLSPAHVLTGHGGRVSCLAFSPCGSQLATGSSEGQVWLWSTADGSCQRKLSGHGSLVTAVCFSPCGSLLASASGRAFSCLRCS